MTQIHTQTQTIEQTSGEALKHYSHKDFLTRLQFLPSTLVFSPLNVHEIFILLVFTEQKNRSHGVCSSCLHFFCALSQSVGLKMKIDYN